MTQPYIFDFNTDVAQLEIPSELNNPFGNIVPEIAQRAAMEFQTYLVTTYPAWNQGLLNRRGKMLGVLVVQKEDGSYGYLGAASGNLSRGVVLEKFIPSVFDDATDDYLINKGMTELTTIGNLIKASTDEGMVKELMEERKGKSFKLQQWLFSNYHFQNLQGEERNVLEIFKESSQGNPPAATGECAGPKLLQFAFQHSLRPIAIGEFWWGVSPKGEERQHGEFYPACKNKCRPILEFMLEDDGMYDTAIEGV